MSWICQNRDYKQKKEYKKEYKNYMAVFIGNLYFVQLQVCHRNPLRARAQIFLFFSQRVYFDKISSIKIIYQLIYKTR